MTMEVREILSWVALDTSGQVLGGSTPKRLESMVLVMPLPPKLEDFPKLLDTSSQAGALDEGKLDNPTPEEVPPPTPHNQNPRAQQQHPSLRHCPPL